MDYNKIIILGNLPVFNCNYPPPPFQVESSLGRMRASKQMLSDMESSFDNTVLAVRKNRDDLTPLQGLKSLKLKVGFVFLISSNAVLI